MGSENNGRDADRNGVEYGVVASEERKEEFLEEVAPAKVRFPKTVILIVLIEFCERFSYSGMKVFLALYLKQKLFYSDDEATEIYHIFSTLVYFFPVFGAILADSYLGKYKTILYIMVLYTVGNVLLAVTAIPVLGIPGREFTLLGLLLVALGTGGIKPCVSAFGGDQFVLPQQEKQLTTYFAFFYFVICVGALLAKTISPLLRSEVQCFGDKDCYSFAFGAPVILIVLSIVIFIFARKLFVIKKPKGNVVVDVVKCISKAIKSKLRSSTLADANRHRHWLDHANGDFEQTFIDDVKRTLRIFVLFAPLPVFWSLLDQLGSRWMLQASRMDGKFSFFTVKPDQMQVVCPITILATIPLFKKVLYPCLGKCGVLLNPLHKLIAGCVLAAIAFVSSGVLEVNLEKTYPILPSKGVGQMRIFNGYDNCQLRFEDNSNSNYTFVIEPLDYYENKSISVDFNRTMKFEKTVICPQSTDDVSMVTLELMENSATSFFFAKSKDKVLKYTDSNKKSRSGFPFIRFLTDDQMNQTNLNITLYNIDRENVEFATSSNFTDQIEAFANAYDLYVNSKKALSGLELKIGGVYTAIVSVSETNSSARVVTITDPNSVSMVWILPQVLLMSMAEVLFAIPGLEFAFKEAPESMRSVLQAHWMLVEALGNVIIIVVTRLAADRTQREQFFFYAAMMAAATCVFALMARRYDAQTRRIERGDTMTFNFKVSSEL